MKQNLRIDPLLPVVKFWVVYTKLQTFLSITLYPNTRNLGSSSCLG